MQLSKSGEDLSADNPQEAQRASFGEPTARILCAALLADSLEQTQSLLAAALREDPSFLLWTRTVAVQSGEAEGLSEDALAQWLANRLPEVLEEKGDITDFQHFLIKCIEHNTTHSSNISDVPFFAELLPLLAEKMARLKTLQADFAAAVQHEKLSALAEFAAGAGHEINNPLTVIAGRAQLLLHEETDPERRHALALMNTQAMRVYEMIADMMLFARPPKPHPARVDILRLLDDVIRQMQPQADRQETALKLTGATAGSSSSVGPGTNADSLRSGGGTAGQASSVTHEPLEIIADPVQLMVALKAIVQNSLEALGSGGHVELELRVSATDVEILLRDDGPGIPAEVRPHVFDPFYSARQAGRGLGLGLAKAWRIITNHHGRLEVETPTGPGATLRITLPR